ncbi:MAG: carboxypeptidase-like regulatory domain-containing protein [Candidatus Wallbacteria bacterium]
MKKLRKGYKIFNPLVLLNKIKAGMPSEFYNFPAGSGFSIKKNLNYIFFLIFIILSSALAFYSANYELAFAQEKFEFVKVIGMVAGEKNQKPVADCLVIIGSKTARTNENGFFEISNIISGEYSVKAEHPQYAGYVDIKILDQPINGLKILLKTEKAEETQKEKLNKEYDKLWAKLMKLNKKEIIVGEEAAPVKKKSSGYYSKYGRSSGANEPSSGFKYSKITPEEKEKSSSPKIDTKGGFSKLIGRVYESNGSQIETEARISFGPQTIKTSEFGAFEIENVPAGVYSVTIRAKGYITKVYEKVKLKNGINKYDFYLTKSSSGSK